MAAQPIDILNWHLYELLKPVLNRPPCRGPGMHTVDTPNGVVVTKIDVKSMAAASNLRENDIIIAVNRKRVSNKADMRTEIKNSKQSPRLTILRKRETPMENFTDSGGYMAFLVDLHRYPAFGLEFTSVPRPQPNKPASKLVIKRMTPEAVAIGFRINDSIHDVDDKIMKKREEDSTDKESFLRKVAESGDDIIEVAIYRPGIVTEQVAPNTVPSPPKSPKQSAASAYVQQSKVASVYWPDNKK